MRFRHISETVNCQREFQRATRSLDCLTHWKGTEYRSFLHYVGCVALKDHLVSDAYENFLLLFCAVTICSSKRHAEHRNVARLMIEEFIELYGSHYMMSNMHNLCHLVDEVELFGELQTFTAYPFENMLGKIKRLLRSGYRPLAQVAKRIMENNSNIRISQVLDSSIIVTPISKQRRLVVKIPFGSNNIPEYLIQTYIRDESVAGYHCEIQIDEEYTLSAAKQEDSWFLTNADKIGRLMNVISIDKNNVKVCYAEYSTSENFFKNPCESKLLDIHSVRRHCDSVIKIADIDCIQCKVVCLKYAKDDMYVFVPLSHTQ